MVAASETFAPERSRAFQAIFWGGLIAGILDITYACVFSYMRSGISPVRILQSVASGMLGAKAFEGGLPTATLGLFFHFLIAFTAAVVYYAASRKLDVLVRAAIVCGVIYGALIYVFMNYVVLPLSAAPFKGNKPALITFATGLLVHMFCIGLPIALAVRRYSK
jgi:uncharacterized membrane protein YagU involved in acid resistance